MRERVLGAGFAAKGLRLLGPNSRNMNLVAIYRGRTRGALKPILVICHFDVVGAKWEDWTTDPFVFTDKDRFFYGRGRQDIKEGDPAGAFSLIRMKRETYIPDCDRVVALTADEEGGQLDGVVWLDPLTHRTEGGYARLLREDYNHHQRRDGERE